MLQTILRSRLNPGRKYNRVRGRNYLTKKKSEAEKDKGTEGERPKRGRAAEPLTRLHSLGLNMKP